MESPGNQQPKSNWVQSDFPEPKSSKSRDTRTPRPKRTETPRRMRTDSLGARVRMRPVRKQKLPPIEDLKMKNTREGSSEMEDLIPSECEITASQFAKGYEPRFRNVFQKRGKYGSVFEVKSPVKRPHQDVQNCATKKLDGKSNNPATASEDVHVQHQQCVSVVGNDVGRLEVAGTPEPSIHQHQLNLGVVAGGRSSETGPQLHKNTPERQKTKAVAQSCQIDNSERYTAEHAQPLVTNPAPIISTVLKPSQKKKRRNKLSKRSRRESSSDSDGPSVIPDSQDPPEPVIQIRQKTLVYDTSDSEEERRPYQLGNTIEGIPFHNLPSNRKPVREPSPVNRAPLFFPPLFTQQSPIKEKVVIPTQIVKYDDNGDVISSDDDKGSDGEDNTENRTKCSENLMDYLSPVPVFDHSPSSVSREAVGNVDQNLKRLRFETPGKVCQIVLAEDTPESQYRNGAERVVSTEDLVLSSDENNENEDGLEMPRTQQF